MLPDRELIPVVLFVIFGFLVGGIWFFFSSLGRPLEERKKRTWKYWSYAGIVSISGLAASFGGWVWLLFSVSLILFGIWELSQSLRKANLILISIAFGFCLPIGFAFAASYSVLNSHLLIWLYLGVAGFDAFSQIVGQSLGLRKLSPVISPNKTWEGFVGGLIYLVLFSGFLFQFWGRLSGKGFSLAILLGFLALLGDLSASWLKRKLGIKDYSALLPGHGGILDRYDSFIFAVGVWTILVIFGIDLATPWY